MKKPVKIGLITLSVGLVLLGLGTVAMHFWTSETDPNARQVKLTPFTQIDSDTAAYGVNVRTGANYHASVAGKYKEEITVKVKNHELVIREVKLSTILGTSSSTTIPSSRSLCHEVQALSRQRLKPQLVARH